MKLPYIFLMIGGILVLVAALRALPDITALKRMRDM
jgi:TRAP-type C4-dicarboxylate transport system permease small subunit